MSENMEDMTVTITIKKDKNKSSLTASAQKDSETPQIASGEANDKEIK